MGLRILHDTETGQAAIYCSTSEFAFGPVFQDGANGKDAAERAEAFLRCLPEFGYTDPRHVPSHVLPGLHAQWLRQEDDQYRREDQEKAIESAEHAMADR